MNKGDLLHLFREYGWIQDIYISRKERRFTNLCFGFVGFSYEDEAVKAARKLKGVRIFVKIARFTREERPRYEEENQEMWSVWPLLWLPI